jgi:hypothetical protein
MPAPDSLYSHIGRQLGESIPRFGLNQHSQRIYEALEVIGMESLDFPVGGRPLFPSQINENSIPFQYGVALTADSAPALQFICEMGFGGSSNFDRLQLALRRIPGLLKIFDAISQESTVSELLDSQLPETRLLLSENQSSAIWIAAGFRADVSQLKIYVNAKWGNQEHRWERMGRFARYFGQGSRWDELKPDFIGSLEPLGVCISAPTDAPCSGRVYLSGYGRPISFYEQISECCAGCTFGDTLRDWASALLKEDYFYPTASCVCSFGFCKGERNWDFKFEMCGHCIFTEEAQARQKILAGLAAVKLDPSGYLELLSIISEGKPIPSGRSLHSYFGIGKKSTETYSTCYLKPVP